MDACWSFDSEKDSWTFRLHSRDVAGCDPARVADAIASSRHPGVPLIVRQYVARMFLCVPGEAIETIVATRLAKHYLAELLDEELAAIGFIRSDLQSDFWHDKIEVVRWLVRWLVFEVEITTYDLHGFDRINTINPTVSVADPWDRVWDVGDDYIDAGPDNIL